MKDILNSRVKHRQAFRPFAPIVLAERHEGDFRRRRGFALHADRQAGAPEWRDKIPAIVHVDGTARVQTVREATNPMLYRLLKEFEALTGVPVLINTSFNIKGEPIVETPQDAVNCFLTTGRRIIWSSTIRSSRRTPCTRWSRRCSRLRRRAGRWWPRPRSRPEGGCPRLASQISREPLRRLSAPAA
jgi:carbamoyltransferase